VHDFLHKLVSDEELGRIDCRYGGGDSIENVWILLNEHAALATSLGAAVPVQVVNGLATYVIDDALRGKDA
jgi:hypothetical protein